MKAVEAKAEKKKNLVKMKKSAVEKKLEGKKKVVEEKKKLVQIKAESKLSLAQDKKALAAIKEENKGYNYYGDSGSKKGKIKKSSGKKEKYKIVKKKKKNDSEGSIKYEKFTRPEYPIQNKFNVLDELKNLFWKYPNKSETIQM